MGVLKALAGILGGGAQVAQQRGAGIQQTAGQQPARQTEEIKKKGKAAAQLALIKTSQGGILSESTTGRRKLLGN